MEGAPGAGGSYFPPEDSRSLGFLLTLNPGLMTPNIGFNFKRIAEVSGRLNR